MPTEIEIYADYMTGVRMRVEAIKSTMVIAAMAEFAKAEMVFLQFPKALELMSRTEFFDGVGVDFGHVF
jgi:hypothetical protein